MCNSNAFLPIHTHTHVARTHTRHAVKLDWIEVSPLRLLHLCPLCRVLASLYWALEIFLYMASAIFREGETEREISLYFFCTYKGWMAACVPACVVTWFYPKHSYTLYSVVRAMCINDTRTRRTHSYTRALSPAIYACRMCYSGIIQVYTYTWCVCCICTVRPLGLAAVAQPFIINHLVATDETEQGKSVIIQCLCCVYRVEIKRY